MLAKLSGETDWKSVCTLGELQKAKKLSLDEMTQFVKEKLKSEPYSRQEILHCFDITDEELKEMSLTSNTANGSN